MRTFPFVAVSLSLLASAGTLLAQEPDAGAMRTFADLVKRTREHPSLTISCELDILVLSDTAQLPRQTLNAEFIRSKNGDGRITFDGYTILVHGGLIHVFHSSNADEYFVAQAEEYVNSAVVYDCFGLFSRIPFPHIAILWGETSNLEELVMELYMDTSEIVPVSVSDRVAGDQSVRTLEFSGGETKMLVNFDPRTMLIESITHRTRNGVAMPAGASEVVSTYSFTTTVHDETLPESTFEFVEGDRQRIDDMSNLRKDRPAEAPPPVEEPQDMPEPPGAMVGREAPQFALRATDGNLVNLADLKGQVVVLDFWAVWCPPCRAALPKLHEVANWATEENLPVRFYTINTFENGRTAEDKKRTATRYWQDSGHTLPVLMDDANEIAGLYEVRGIPATFIIGPDGIVAAHHDGFDAAKYVEDLKRQIREALGKE